MDKTNLKPKIETYITIRQLRFLTSRIAEGIAEMPDNRLIPAKLLTLKRLLMENV